MGNVCSGGHVEKSKGPVLTQDETNAIGSANTALESITSGSPDREAISEVFQFIGQSILGDPDPGERKFQYLTLLNKLPAVAALVSQLTPKVPDSTLVAYDRSSDKDKSRLREIQEQGLTPYHGSQEALQNLQREDQAKLDRFRLLIPDNIAEGVDDEDGNRNKATKLYDNFRANFSYYKYGGDNSAIVTLLTGTGDCSSLAQVFYVVARALGIDDAKPESYDFPCVFEPGAAFGRNGDGNTHEAGESYWVYANHFWATAGGRVYDLLAGVRAGSNPADYYTQEGGDITHEDSSVTYRKFDSGNICWIPATQNNKGILGDIGREGIVPGNEETTIRFIVTKTT